MRLVTCVLKFRYVSQMNGDAHESFVRSLECQKHGIESSFEPLQGKIVIRNSLLECIEIQTFNVVFDRKEKWKQCSSPEVQTLKQEEKWKQTKRQEVKMEGMVKFPLFGKKEKFIPLIFHISYQIERRENMFFFSLDWEVHSSYFLFFQFFLLFY